MPIDQYSKFLAIIPEIETALKAKGVEVVRPVFNKRSGGDIGSDDSAAEEEGESGGERQNKKVARAEKITNGDGNRKRNGVKKDVRKKNFEATSDEEEVVPERTREAETDEE
jgi:hypothetical protein